MALDHGDSTNNGRIANPIAGGERAAKPAQSMYWSCHDRIRTPKLNSSQSCRNCRMEPWCRYNPAPNLQFYVRSAFQLSTGDPAMFFVGSWPWLGPPVRYQPGPHPGNRELLETPTTYPHRYEVFESHPGWLHPRFLTFSSILHIICIFIFHLSVLSTTPTLLQQRKLSYPSLCLDAMITSWYLIQQILSQAYTEYSVYRVQYTPSTVKTEYSIYAVLFISRTVYTE